MKGNASFFGALLLALVPGNLWAGERFTESSTGADAVVSDALTGLIWQKSPAGEAKSWQAALSYCEESTAANTGDWRLPSVHELESLVDVSTHSPATFKDGSTAYVSVSDDKFWSGTTYGKDHADAWYVEFNYGITYKDEKPDDLKVICVRYALRNNGDGTITDPNLGLTWMKCPQGMAYNAATNQCDGIESEFQYCTSADSSCNGNADDGILDSGPAFESCNTLNYADHTDWRVPTRDELRSLVKCADGKTPGDEDYCGEGNYTSPAIDISVFPSSSPSVGFWSSSSYASHSSYAWLVNFNYGLVGTTNKTNDVAVVCVR